jgi:hypothetical protein
MSDPVDFSRLNLSRDNAQLPLVAFMAAQEDSSMDNREQLRRAIPIVVARTIRAGQPVDVAKLAARLSARYPHSGIAMDEIYSEIEAAVHRQTARMVYAAA